MSEVVLVGFSLAGQPPARSWLGRVASHWLREYGGKRPAVHLATELLSSLDPVRLKEVAGRTRPVTDDAAGLSSRAPRTPRRHWAASSCATASATTTCW